jgi:hypothetical protein
VGDPTGARAEEAPRPPVESEAPRDSQRAACHCDDKSQELPLCAAEIGLTYLSIKKGSQVL